MSMMLTARHVPAAEGLELGFVNEVVEPDQLMSRAKEWAHMILACSPMSIRATKEAAMAGFEQGGIRAAYEGKYDAVTALFKSEDFIEGPKAFSEKREPNWTGR